MDLRLGSTTASYGRFSASPRAPTIYLLKPQFQSLLRPLAKRLATSGLTANQVTVGAAALCMGAGIFLTFHHVSPGWFLLLPVVLFARMALNALDGIMARDFGQQSPLGAYLNELGDVVSDAFLFLPFSVVDGIGELWIASLIGLAATAYHR
jgi:CDP-diacylglycerol--glycerol-3-phosphate 3-phosphatidyltransferase